MHEIINLTNSPYDLATLGGSVHLPARGSVKDVFAPEYLEALRGSGMYDVSEVRAPSRPKKV